MCYNRYFLTLCFKQSLGQLGQVSMIDPSGNLVLWVNGRQWVMDSFCVVPAPGEQPDDELSTAVPTLVTTRVYDYARGTSHASMLFCAL